MFAGWSSREDTLSLKAEPYGLRLFSGCCCAKLFFLLAIAIHSYLLQDNCCPFQQCQGPIVQVSSAIGNFKVVYVVVVVLNQSSLVLFFQALNASLTQNPVHKGATRQLKRGFGQGRGVIGQGGMASDWQKTGIDYVSGRNSSLWWCWGTGTFTGRVQDQAGWCFEQPGVVALSWQGGWN